MLFVEPSDPLLCPEINTTAMSVVLIGKMTNQFVQIPILFPFLLIIFQQWCAHQGVQLVHIAS